MSTSNNNMFELDLIKVVVVDRDHDTLVRTVQAMMATQRVDVVSETTTYSIACSVIDRHQPEFVVVGVDEEKVHVIEKIKTRCPNIKIIAVGEAANPETILKAFRSGSEEFLQRPLFAEELNPVFERLRKKNGKSEQQALPQGRILAFIGSRGGVGTSTLARNVAHQLSYHASTVLVDFHFGQGDLAVHCNLQPAFSLRDLSETDEPIDHALIDSVSQQLKDNLRAIFQPYDCQPYLFGYEHISTLLTQLRTRYKYVVLDVGNDLERALDWMELINDWFLILTQDLPAIFMASRKMQRMVQAGFEAQNVNILINQYEKSHAVSLGRVARALQRKDLNPIRTDQKRVASSINQGIPLEAVSAWGKAHKDIKKLVERWLKQEPAEPVVVQETQSNELPSLLNKTSYA